MLIKQLYTSCLSQACYYIESRGEAAIIDPLRDIGQYTELLHERGATLKYIFETHFHADFVSGHQDLAKATGGVIVFGPGAAPAYETRVAEDRSSFTLGEVRIELWHTPGHTMESSCFILFQNEKPACVFTGDTLFIGDVGRPDLVQKVKKEITPEFLASQLYDSLFLRLMTLPDETIIYPGHGAGSACGKHMSKETSDTIGHQKQFNYAFNPALKKEEFVRLVLNGLTEPPAYFPQNVLRNVLGNEKSYEDILLENLTPIHAEDFDTLAEQTPGLVVLDTRKKEAYIESHIPGALFAGLDDNFAPWVGTIIDDLNTPILLVVEESREMEAVRRLSRVGYDQCIGFLFGGMEAWKQAGKISSQTNSISAAEVEQDLSLKKDIILLDVRRKNEYEQAHVEGALNIPVDYLKRNLNLLSETKPVYVHCAAGYRSVIACSILEKEGRKNIRNVTGGFQALRQTSLSIRTQEVEIIDI